MDVLCTAWNLTGRRPEQIAADGKIATPTELNLAKNDVQRVNSGQNSVTTDGQQQQGQEGG
jgi:hypothetical protein